MLKLTKFIASKHWPIPSVNIYYLQDPMLSTSGYKEVRKITPTCNNSAIKALECLPYAMDTVVHLPKPPSSEDPQFQRLEGSLHLSVPSGMPSAPESCLPKFWPLPCGWYPITDSCRSIKAQSSQPNSGWLRRAILAPEHPMWLTMCWKIAPWTCPMTLQVSA